RRGLRPTSSACTFTTHAGPRWPTWSPLWTSDTAPSTRPQAAPADRPLRPARPATSPPKIWSTCSTARACATAPTWTGYWPRDASWPSGSAERRKAGWAVPGAGQAPYHEPDGWRDRELIQQAPGDPRRRHRDRRDGRPAHRSHGSRAQP